MFMDLQLFDVNINQRPDLEQVSGNYAIDSAARTVH